MGSHTPPEQLRSSALVWRWPTTGSRTLGSRLASGRRLSPWSQRCFCRLTRSKLSTSWLSWGTETQEHNNLFTTYSGQLKKWIPWISGIDAWANCKTTLIIKICQMFPESPYAFSQKTCSGWLPKWHQLGYLSSPRHNSTACPQNRSACEISDEKHTFRGYYLVEISWR